MKLILLCMFISIFSLLLIIISYYLSWKMSLNSESMSSFECGFLSFYKLRKPFSLRFFLIALIFIIFDIEIIIMLPLTFMQSFNILNTMSIIIMISVILYGLLYEWYIGSITWAM